jgi:hypothetical protein
VLTQQVTTHHLIPAAKEGLYHPAEDAIFSALAKGGNDVSVYWGVYESGKATAVRNAGLKLQQMDRLCVLLHGYDLTFPTDFASTLRMRIGIPKDERASLSTYITRPTSVVIDHFDLLGMLVDKAITPIRELNTPTVLVVSSWERARELRDKYGCKLVEPVGVGRWTRDQLETLFQTLPPSVKDMWEGLDKEELMQLSVTAGAAGYLTFVADKEKHRSNTRRAEILAAEWRNGVRALGGGGEEGVDGGGGCAVGRFPDRDGVFHWD